MIEKCSCYHTAEQLLGWIGPDEPLTHTIGICFGTKDREQCFCRGSESECDFYSEKRKPKFGKWISVDDELPKGECIALNGDKGTYGYGEMIIGYVSYDNVYKYYMAENDHEALFNVTHWMPKPELPKED